MIVKEYPWKGSNFCRILFPRMKILEVPSRLNQRVVGNVKEWTIGGLRGRAGDVDDQKEPRWGRELLLLL
jgi:hypothetical protein